LAYRTIKTFREYLLVNQYQIQVEHCLKTAANQWLLSEYTDPQVILNLNSVGLKLKIADMYKNVEFTEA
jgi:Uma2 family endonuclease